MNGKEHFENRIFFIETTIIISAPNVRKAKLRNTQMKEVGKICQPL